MINCLNFKTKKKKQRQEVCSLSLVKVSGGRKKCNNVIRVGLINHNKPGTEPLLRETLTA